MTMDKNSKIYIAGHRGLVGNAIKTALELKGYKNLILKTREELDLLDGNKVKEFFTEVRPEYVFLAAAKVGGIMANKTQPANFIYENLVIQNNVIHNAYLSNVKKLMFLGSSCIYPKNAPQPIKEEYLMTGILEETNDAYSVAKIAGMKMCQAYNKQYGANFISVMPTNIYGENDNFDLQSSHVIPALIRKFHDAHKTQADFVSMWGTGSASREFLYVDDLADACIFLMENYEDPTHINVGTGEDISIKNLAVLISNIVGFKGKIVWDSQMPDGIPRKLLDVTKLHSLGWKHITNLEEGIRKTYQWYIKHEAK